MKNEIQINIIQYFPKKKKKIIRKTMFKVYVVSIIYCKYALYFLYFYSLK